jgi:hypothetical protein
MGSSHLKSYERVKITSRQYSERWIEARHLVIEFGRYVVAIWLADDVCSAETTVVDVRAEFDSQIGGL